MGKVQDEHEFSIHEFRAIQSNLICLAIAAGVVPSEGKQNSLEIFADCFKSFKIVISRGPTIVNSLLAEDTHRRLLG